MRRLRLLALGVVLSAQAMSPGSFQYTEGADAPSAATCTSGGGALYFDTTPGSEKICRCFATGWKCAGMS